MKKSDPGIVAKKAANKGARALAESLERRAGTEGNPGGASTGRTQRRGSVSQGAERMAERKPQEKLTALLHHGRRAWRTPTADCSGKRPPEWTG